MNIKERTKLNNLKRYVKMESEEDVRLFDITVYELAATKDPEILSELIDIFDDDCEFHEVMFSLVHAIETYPQKIYIETIVKKFKDSYKYPEWFLILIYSILNHPESYQILKENIHLADPKSLNELLDLMCEESERHQPQIEELRNLISK